MPPTHAPVFAADLATSHEVTKPSIFFSARRARSVASGIEAVGAGPSESAVVSRPPRPRRKRSDPSSVRMKSRIIVERAQSRTK